MATMHVLITLMIMSLHTIALRNTGAVGDHMITAVPITAEMNQLVAIGMNPFREALRLSTGP